MLQSIGSIREAFKFTSSLRQHYPFRAEEFCSALTIIKVGIESAAHYQQMVCFSSKKFSKAKYARFRSSLALDRFADASDDLTRRYAAKWANAWLCLAKKNAPSTMLSQGQQRAPSAEFPSSQSSTASNSTKAQIVVPGATQARH
ncbi:hypothetical protein [Duganella sp. Root336D2]|uniref:hypothetical protein n=1 Tax=Duganella sp. Root336D2 TaxID=1736518 RepID=UPI0012E3E91E|nr:hypothetical protein [Duganella sp. Root336D2]